MKKISTVIGVIAFILFFSSAPRVFALSYSPATIYPGTPYTLSESVSNSTGSPISVTKDCFYWKNGVYGGAWGHEVITVPPGGTTATCSSTGDTAGSVMSFQMNIWRPDYNGTVSPSNTGFTVQAPAGSPSANLFPSGDVYPNTALSLSGSVSGSGYTGTNCWAYSVNGGARSCWFSPGSGTGNFSYNWNAGSADTSTSYTFYLCTDNGAGACATAGSLRVINPPPPTMYALSVLKVGSGTVSGTGISCGTDCSEPYTSGTKVYLAATPDSGWSLPAASPYGWSGCDSVGINQSGQATCAITLTSDKTVSVSFSQLAASANLTSPGDGYNTNYKSSLYLQWTSANTTGCNISVSPSLPGFPKTNLPSSHTGSSYSTGPLTQNEVFTLACSVVSGASGTASAVSNLTVNPAPTAPCEMFVANDIFFTTAFSVPSWGVVASGNTNNCPSAYFTNLRVSASAALDSPGGPNPVRVFDFDAPGTGGGGTYLPWDARVNCDYVTRMQEDGGRALQNSGTVAKACSGGGTFLPATGALGLEKDFPPSTSGATSFGSTGYINTDPFRSGLDLFYHGALPWGNYNFHIDSTFTGTYKCPDGDVPFQIDVPLKLCDYEPKGGGDTRYYDSQCVPLNPNRASVPLNCPSVPATVTVVPKIPPDEQKPLDFTHLLQVQSKLESQYEPGVGITQVGDAVALDKNGVPLSPKEIISPSGTGEGADFGGTTQYEKHAVRNFRVTLEAPKDRTSPSGSFVRWDGCDSLSPNGKQCTVSFVFDANGGKTKTITANYTAKLDAPVVLTSTPSCDAVGGKVNITLQSAISGATGYKLYRKSAASSFSLIKTFTSANAPVSGSANAPYIDSGITAGIDYSYKMEAYNSSVTSPASAQTSRAASLPCPDLVVESISIKKTDGTTAPTPITSGTALRFSASIKNQGGTIPSAQSFQNQFVLNGNTSLFSPRTLNGLSAGLSEAVTTLSAQAWPSTEGTHSIEVCADRPPATPGLIDETAPNETNNCATLNFSVLAPLKVDLECKKPDGVYDQNYCIVDYAQTSNLRWTVEGTPSACRWVQSDVIGDAAKQSYTVTGNPFSLNNLLNKLNFTYQLECTR